MSKSKHILFPSKEKGWGLWRVENDSKSLLETFAIDDEIEVPTSTKIALSSHDVASWPLILPMNDKLVQRQMAHLNLEQHGLLKADSDNWDVFAVSDEENVHAGVVLSRDNLSHHKSHTNQIFDVAARLYQVGLTDCILCKREHDRWISIFYKDAKPFYWEPVESLDSLDSQVHILALEFAQQNIPFTPEKVIIELSDEDISESENDFSKPEIIGDLRVDYVQEVDVRDETDHNLTLSPDSVKLERKKRKQRRNIQLLVLLALVAYSITAFFLYEQYKSRDSEVDILEDQVALLNPAWEQNKQDLDKLNELDDVMVSKWPLAFFERVHKHLPRTQELRFQTVEIQSNVILVSGVSPNINLINAFFQNLKKDDYFEDYVGKMPVQTKNTKTKLWEFTITITKQDSVNEL